MTEMQWSPQQEKAIAKASEWAKTKKGDQVHRLLGYAGTGKTTLAEALIFLLEQK